MTVAARIPILPIVALLILTIGTQTSRGQTPEPVSTSRPAEVPRNVSPLSVAILDFDADAPGQPKLGEQISEMLVALLSAEPDLRLVDRAALARTLQEQELSLSGVVDTQQAVKVGRLAGARVLVVGKSFALGQQTFLTAKLIGTETSLVEGVLIKGAADADIASLVVELSAKIAEQLRTSRTKLLPADEARDPLADIRKRLEGIRRVKVAVVITEAHIARARPVVDPAAETEIKRLLSACDFPLQDVPENELADVVRLLKTHGKEPWPQSLAGVDVVIVGEGFSEFAARIGGLVSCSARVEVNVIDRRTGQIWLADRTTQRGVDLSENIAAKQALQHAGNELGLRVLDALASRLAAPPDERAAGDGEGK